MDNLEYGEVGQSRGSSYAYVPFTLVHFPTLPNPFAPPLWRDCGSARRGRIGVRHGRLACPHLV
jgi:hypothetical protein